MRYNRHYDYIVVFGNDRYSVDNIYHNRKHYDYLKDARKATENYLNAYIFKMYYSKDSGDMIYYTSVY